jgi:hypothetical protein
LHVVAVLQWTMWCFANATSWGLLQLSCCVKQLDVYSSCFVVLNSFIFCRYHILMFVPVIVLCWTTWCFAHMTLCDFICQMSAKTSNYC